MQIVVDRKVFQEKATIGNLSVDGVFQCDTLEDVDRYLETGGVKTQDETAIPRGIYKVILSHSPRLSAMFEGKDLPELLDVPDYVGVRVHPGNTDKDTDGCILVGSTYGNDFVGNSRVTFFALLDKMEAAYDRNEPITIEVK